MTELAVDDGFRRLYSELKHMASGLLRAERNGHTFSTSDLVHEVYLKLTGGTDLTIAGRDHFLCLCALAMRRILVDYARARQAEKRSGGAIRLCLQDTDLAVEDPILEVLALDAALDRLATLDPLAARIVELRFFGGLQVEEVARIVAVTSRTVRNHWSFARAWLRSEMSAEPPSGAHGPGAEAAPGS